MASGQQATCAWTELAVHEEAGPLDDKESPYKKPQRPKTAPKTVKQTAKQTGEERRAHLESLVPPASADSDLVARLKRLAAAIKENDRLLVGWLAEKIGDAETAKDIAQDAYLRVWRYAQTTPIESPRALLFKTAANLAANEFRARQRWRKHHVSPTRQNEDEDPLAEVASLDPTPEEVATANNDAQLSLDVINALPDKVRRAFIMSRFEEKTYAEIAVALSVSVSSVEKYMITALKKLKQAVQEAETKDENIVRFPGPPHKNKNN